MKTVFSKPRSPQSFAVRLTRSLTALIRQPDGHEVLTQLAPGFVVLVVADPDSIGLVTVRDAQGQEYRLFLIDVKARGERLIVQAA